MPTVQNINIVTDKLNVDRIRTYYELKFVANIMIMMMITTTIIIINCIYNCKQ